MAARGRCAAASICSGGPAAAWQRLRGAWAALQVRLAAASPGHSCCTSNALLLHERLVLLCIVNLQVLLVCQPTRSGAAKLILKKLAICGQALVARAIVPYAMPLAGPTVTSCALRAGASSPSAGVSLPHQRGLPPAACRSRPERPLPNSSSQPLSLPVSGYATKLGWGVVCPNCCETGSSYLRPGAQCTQPTAVETLLDI